MTSEEKIKHELKETEHFDLAPSNTKGNLYLPLTDEALKKLEKLGKKEITFLSIVKFIINFSRK
jgi:hypothetical protein